MSQVEDTASRRFFFCHLQKTAGSSLIRRLRRHFSRDRVYPEPAGDVASVISVPRLVQRWQETGGAIDLVAGHFPLCTQELLGAEFSTFTILREPVERTLSLIRHHRTRTPASRDKTDEEIYADQFRFHGLIHNHMVKMLSLTAAEMTHGMLTRVDFTPDRLARAQERLARVDVFGLQEHFEDFCAELHDRFGFELGPPVFWNRTRPATASRSLRDRIAEDNALDVTLYEWASRHLRSRARRRTG